MLILNHFVLKQYNKTKPKKKRRSKLGIKLENKQIIEFLFLECAEKEVE